MSAPAAPRTRYAPPDLVGLRQALAEAIEAAIDALDALDGDPDLELEPDLEEGGDLEPEEAQASVHVAINWPPGFDPFATTAIQKRTL